MSESIDNAAAAIAKTAEAYARRCRRSNFRLTISAQESGRGKEPLSSHGIAVDVEKMPLQHDITFPHVKNGEQKPTPPEIENTQSLFRGMNLLAS